MPVEEYSMTAECCESYRVPPRADGGCTITIQVCPRFADLWMTKLDALVTNDAEIAQFERENEVQ